MGLIDNIRDKYILAPLADFMTKRYDAVEKGSGISTLDPVLGSKGGVLRFQAQPNTQTQTRNKPGSAVSFDNLRAFSVSYEVARACINARKRQITQLEWSIVASDEGDKTDYSRNIDFVTAQFKSLGGYRVRLRELLDVMIEDILVLDALALYKQKTMSGEFMNFIPVDGATIRLLVDESGGTPMPPDPAYRQIIRGAVTAELTADEMVYEMMNPRTSTPYGLAPLESLILIVSSALKSNMFNLNYLTDGNIPEGFYSVPSWSSNQIKEFQTIWDAALAGDARATSKLRFVPEGTYTPTKKRDDMAFKEFNEWLLQLTCANFDVQPQEIGFTMHVNRANGQQQGDITTRRGILPLANLITEIFTETVQMDMGFPELKFAFQGLEDRDAKADAETNEILIRSGQRTIDEIRVDEGKTAMGMDRLLVPNSLTFADSLGVPPLPANAPTDAQIATPPTPPANTADDPIPAQQKSVDAGETHVQLVTELRKFRTYAVKRVKEGKALRKFDSEVLPPEVVDELNKRLGAAKTPEDVRATVGEYMQDYQVDFLANVAALKRDLAGVL